MSGVAAGAQWLANGEFNQSGWLACFADGLPLWERSLDVPVLGMRRIDTGSFDIVTREALSTVQSTGGTLGNRRPIDLPFSNAIARFFGKNVLVSDTIPNPAASVFDESGALKWSTDAMRARDVVGMTPSGSLYLAGYDQALGTAMLYSVETGAMSDVSAASLARATLDINDPSVNQDCVAYCNKALAAQCEALLGAPFTTVAE